MSTSEEFECTQCGKRFGWTTKLAGRQVRCSCGSVMICPAEPQPLELYDIAPPAQSAATTSAVKPAATASSPSAPKATLQYRAPSDDVPINSDTDKIKHLYMPLWLLCGGMLVEIIAALIRAQGDIANAVLHIGVAVVAGTVVMLGGILIASKARHIALGPFWTTVLRLSAIAVAPGAVVTLLSPLLGLLSFGLPILSVIGLPLGALLGLGLQFILYFALLGVMFDLDESDTWYCVWVIFLVRLAVYFAAGYALGK